MHRTPDTSGGQSPPLLQAALEYHRRGWSIIPIAAGAKNPPKRFRWKPYQTRQPEESLLRQWFANGTAGGIAVVLGDVSDLVCRDFDTMGAYEQWVANHPDLAATLPTAATARGRHVYFRSSYRGYVDLGDGELRGDSGHYCLLPPSRHPDGAVYCWLIPLPAGQLPVVDDVRAAGFLDSGDDATESNRDNRANGADRRQQKTTEAIVRESGGCADLAPIDPMRDFEADVQKAIQETLPTGPGRRNRQVLELARALKAIPRLADVRDDDLVPYVRRWHELAKPVISTQAWEETLIDFFRAWPRVKFPRGTEPMVQIFERAQRGDVPKVALHFEQDKLRLLVALCRELQRASGDRPFFLACRTAGRLLDVNHATAWRWMFLLTRTGVIREEQKGDQATRRASRYRYLGD
jgi:hypothetical protein